MSSQSPPASPAQPSTVASPSPEALAAATERRLRQLQAAPVLTPAQQLRLHEKKQRFRRMIDPGILRPNSKENAMSSMKTLLTIAENLLREPDNPKFLRFKPTNTVIKRELVDRKGVLEYAIELGFRPEVENFQPYYTFHKRHTDDLKIGTDILKEFFNLYQEKDQRQAQAEKEEKAVAQAAAERVKLAFLDDRKTKLQRDELEKQAREARGNAPSSSIRTPRSTSEIPDDAEAEESGSEGDDEVHTMGGGQTLGAPPAGGHRLGGDVENAPPPYTG